jgi:outer membrane protein TolC
MNRSMQSTVWRAGWVPAGLLLVLPHLLAAQGPEGQTLEIPTAIASSDAPGSGDLVQELGLVVEEDKLDLTLEQAIALALDRNLTLVVQRYQRSQAIRGIEQNRGAYDLNVEATGGTSENTSPQSSALQATGGAPLVTEGQQTNITLSQLTRLGGTAQIFFNNSRGASSDRTEFFNPSYRIDFDVQYNQPLLSGFGREVTERNLIVARTNAAISREDFQTQVETVIQQTSDGYWNLVESLEQLKVAEESLSLAEDLHRMNQIQVEVGTMAPLEVVTSEARVAARRQDIIRFRAQVEDNADALRRLANLDQLWDVQLAPVTDPEAVHVPIDLGEAVRTALEFRPDIRRRRLENETLELDARVARNLKKPRLDLSARFGYNALDGNLRDRDTGEILALGDYFNALDQITSTQFNGWQLGFTFAYPLQNRDARAQSAIADLAAEQGEVVLDDLELQILTEVRSAARAVRTAIDQIESAKVSRRLAERNLEAEQKRYENGLATTFQVLEIQEDLSEARRIEVSAVIQYRRAETAYFRAIGKLLEEVGVVLSDDLE